MRRSRRRLAIACLFAVAGTIFAMPAAAGNGNGNGNGNANAPGQQKQDDAAAQPAPAEQSAPQQPAAPAQPAPQQQSTSTGHVPPGQAKKTQAASSSSASASSATKNGNSFSSTPGYKPSNSTTHWTHCQTGGSTGAATCAPLQGTANPAGKLDVSKRYGNGKTAAQIAVSRGGVGVTLTGPGNSQPHKTFACGHKDNPSGGVDVHAIKSYDASACAAAPAVVATCGAQGKGHQETQAAMGSCNSSPATASCGTATTCPAPVSPAPVVPAPVVPAPVLPVVVTPTPAQSGTAAATGSSTPLPASASAPATAGGVLAAHATITKPAGHGGVLGTVAHITGGTLPFTGFPIWLAVLIAAGLVAAGAGLRRGAVAQV